MDLQATAELDLFVLTGTVEEKMLLMFSEARDLVRNIFADIITSKLYPIKN